MTLSFTGPRRRCGTCKHFRSSPIPGQGWCTHPELVKPPAMVLVRSKDLSCARPLADVPDKWEAADPTADYQPGSTQKIPAIGAVAPDRPTDPRMAVESSSQPNVVGRVSGPLPAISTVTTDFPVYAESETNVLPAVDNSTVVTGIVGNDPDPLDSRTTYVQEDPFPQRQTSGRRRLIALLAVPLMLCFVLGMAGAFVLVFRPGPFAESPLPQVGTVPTATVAPASPRGTARTDFRLRAEPKTESGQLIEIKSGQQVQLIDSAGGEALDASQPQPSKWYKVRTLDNLAEGWAYSGWITR